MKNQDKIENFFKSFKEKYPNYTIVEFKNLGSPIIIKDENGFLHKKCNALRALNYAFGIESIINKKEFLIYKMKQNEIDLELIEYNGMKEKCIVKDKNGFTYSPTMFDLLAGHPVTIQTCNEKEKLFIFKANIVHNSKYIYPDFVYKNGKQKIKIICKKHGTFYQVCESHLLGRGCNGCKKEVSSFSKSLWIEKYKNRNCIFYVLEFSNNTEKFIKIGVTSRNIKTRYNSKRNSYKYKELLIIKGSSEEVINFEYFFLKKLKEFKYIPKENFEGRTECFTFESKNKIYEHFKQH